MNRIGFNTTGFNSSLDGENVRDFGAQNIEFNFALLELSFVQLTGVASLTFNQASNITLIRPFGNQSVSSSFEVGATLSSFSSKNIGEGQSSIALDASASLAKKTFISGELGIVLDAQADSTLTGGLSGELGIALDAQGSAITRHYLFGELTSQFDAVGDVTKTLAMAGSTEIDHSLSANLAAYVRVELGEASTSIDFSHEADMIAFKRVNMAGTTEIQFFHDASIERTPASVIDFDFQVFGELQAYVRKFVDVDQAILFPFEANAQLDNFRRSYMEGQTTIQFSSQASLSTMERNFASIEFASVGQMNRIGLLSAMTGIGFETQSDVVVNAFTEDVVTMKRAKQNREMTR